MKKKIFYRYIFFKLGFLKFTIFFINIFFISILELIAIGALLPILDFFSNKNNINNSYFYNLFKIFFNLDFGNYQVLLLFFVISIFLFKIILLFFLNKINFLVIGNIQHFITTDIFKNKYSFSNYKNLDNTEIKNTQTLLVSDVDQIRSYLYSLANIGSEFIIFVILFFISSIINLYGTLLVMFAFLTFFIINKIFFKKKLSMFYLSRRFHFSNKLEIISELSRSIQEVLIYKKFSFVKKIFGQSDKYYNYFTNQTLLFQLLPKLFLEFLVLLLFFSLSLLIINSEKFSSTTILFYFLILIRMYPSLNRILANYQNLLYSLPAIEKLNLKKINLHNNSNVKLNLNSIRSISFKNVTFNFKNRAIFKKLNYTIYKNDLIGIFGESGSGKTTFIKIMLGLYKAQKGKILINDKVVSKNNIYEFWEKVAYVPQNGFLFNKSIYENVLLEDKNKADLNQNIKNIKKIFNFIKFRNLNKRQILSKNFLGENNKKISGGEKQKLCLVRALIQNKEILVLDESLSSIDHATQIFIIKNIIRKYLGNKTIIFISHNLKLKKFFKRVIDIDTFFKK